VVNGAILVPSGGRSSAACIFHLDCLTICVTVLSITTSDVGLLVLFSSYSGMMAEGASTLVFAQDGEHH
jgi:hypothetical protein